MLIPLVGLILLIVSFFAKVPEGPKWAGMLFGGIVLQVALGVLAHSVPILGLHPRVLGAAAVLAGLAHGQAGRRWSPARGP